MAEKRYLHLNLVANDINLHQGAYKYEQAHGVPERGTFERLIEYGRFGDEGLFTALFVGDIPGLNGSPAFDGGPAEPITALTAISQHTKHVGLIATASTTFYDPYNLARLLASLDQASDGRAGYNAVTSVIDQFALNYSLKQHLDREARYARADEFLDVMRALWDNRSLRLDADGLTRFYAEPINHQGNLFEVTGPLNVAPSRQGRPLIAQAGGSGAGIRVAAKHAEMVFTNSSTRESAAEYRETLDKALVEQGRTPGSVPPIPGLIPYLGKTTKEAEEKLAELDSYVNWEPIAPFALGQFGLEFTYGDINDPFPVHELPRPADVEKTIKSTFGNYVGLYNWIQERPGVTVREVVAQAVGRGGATHRKFVGTYDALVDDFAAWHEDGNVGGFNLMFSAGSAAIREFIDEVVPRLIDRGIYRSSPHDRPLRERF
ncbi:NtaA/DmoA family FMN-dependent monooxygenase [Mycolicibacterium frederiksbergense]|uniref:NtaA/DmoA family FMN-dependent monooxygenase n=1 Tax=Mycolicibacterium frederiksbergense TaxID=117567 RepID=UPI00265C23B6|nr:NtaA/DmoA family FMN-dependent monooxygenase [Mycolicibacterium frederiksbergense]MDO0977943.1 NtaA/DmoA family FMN-dependent monooxygenase [Mycolicibacterium frederiksbergense]